MKSSLRYEVRDSDPSAVGAIVRSTGFFNAEEQALAASLVEEFLAKGEASGYRFIFAETHPLTQRIASVYLLSQRGSAAKPPGGLPVVAYACYGPIMGTRSSFDLYWIVVHNDQRGNGIGRRLLEATVEAVRAAGGTRLYAETSARPLYAPTRRFYLANGFQQQACLPDFYAPGDGKLIYCRELSD